MMRLTYYVCTLSRGRGRKLYPENYTWTPVSYAGGGENPSSYLITLSSIFIYLSISKGGRNPPSLPLSPGSESAIPLGAGGSDASSQETSPGARFRGGRQLGRALDPRTDRMRGFRYSFLGIVFLQLPPATITLW